MGLLHRYILRQLVGPFAFALSALTSIMLLNQVARRFGHLVGKGLDWSVIAEVFLLSIPFIVAMTMPMAVLLAVLYAFSRLAADSEITAMRASGISVGQLLAPAIAAGVLLSVTNFVFVDQVLPRSNARLRNLLFDIARKKPTLDLTEQIINEIPPSRMFLRAGRIIPNSGRLKDVVIYDLTNQDRPRIIYADSGRMALADNESDLQLQLHHGEVHEFETENARDFKLTAFNMNTIMVRNVSNKLERGAVETVRGDRELSTCEMQDRVRQARRDAGQTRRDRKRFLYNDLRTLLGIPHLAALPPMPAGGGRSLCHAWESLMGLLLPETAEAQERAPPLHSPRRTAVPGAPQDSLSQQKTGKKGGRLEIPLELRRRLRHDSSPIPEGRAAPVEEPVIPRRDLQLTSWADISAARDVETVTRRKANAYLVEIHKKWAISVACLAFVIIGIPMALRFPRGGMGLVIGGGLTVFSIYYVGLTAGESLGDLGRVQPWIPMWAPNIILTVLGVIGLVVVSRHSGTARGGDLADLWLSLRSLVSRHAGTAR